MEALTPHQFSQLLENLVMLRSLEQLSKEIDTGALNGLNAHSNKHIDSLAINCVRNALNSYDDVFPRQLDGIFSKVKDSFSSINRERKRLTKKLGIKTPKILKKVGEEVARVGRQIDKNKEKILAAAALSAAAVVGGPAIIGAVKGAAGWSATMAKTGFTFVKGKAVAGVGAVKGYFTGGAQPPTATDIIDAEKTVKSKAWYSTMYESVKGGLEKAGNFVFGSQASKDLIDGLVLGEQQKILKGLAKEKAKTGRLKKAITAAWVVGLNPQDTAKAKNILRRYAATLNSLDLSQRPAFANEAKAYVTPQILRGSVATRLQALNAIDSISTRYGGAPVSAPSNLLLPALAVAAVVAVNMA